ncbi:F-box protein CPR1-like [Euphorbia lathyris]|uniref:F-box protein CPR1-like n=1 Tax=Euphorbia lathyris TaxID=212925 RepID=UPI0033141530
MDLQLWESLKDAIAVYTALSPATFITVVALGLTASFFIFELFGSYNNHRRSVEVTQEDHMHYKISDMANEVPQELIAEILQLLPAKTLLRFRCICKSLHDTIDSPNFIKLHLTTTSENRTHSKIVFRHFGWVNSINPVPIHVLDMDEPFPPELRKGNPPEPESDEYDEFAHTVFAHCNGLVLLKEDDFSLIVWNPTNRKSRKLPVLPYKEDNLIPCIVGWGFGYVDSIDDYKVLVIRETQVVVHQWDDIDYNYEIWILGLKSCYWRRIELPDDDLYWLTDNFRNCFVDGAFHFLCDDGEVIIFAFDLIKETFSKVSLSDLAFVNRDFEDYDADHNLEVVDGCLCVSLFRSNEYWELYARKRKNDEGEFCWTKLCSIRFEQLSCIQSTLNFPILMGGVILGFSKNGDKIYILYEQYAVYLYDFKEKNIQRIVAGDKRKQKVFSCIESLVWLKKKKKRKKKKAILA